MLRQSMLHNQRMIVRHAKRKFLVLPVVALFGMLCLSLALLQTILKTIQFGLNRAVHHEVRKPERLFVRGDAERDN